MEFAIMCTKGSILDYVKTLSKYGFTKKKLDKSNDEYYCIIVESTSDIYGISNEIEKELIITDKYYFIDKIEDLLTTQEENLNCYHRYYHYFQIILTRL